MGFLPLPPKIGFLIATGTKPICVWRYFSPFSISVAGGLVGIRSVERVEEEAIGCPCRTTVNVRLLL